MIEPNKIYSNGKQMIFCISRVTDLKTKKEVPIIKNLSNTKNYVADDDTLIKSGFKEVLRITEVETAK